MENIKRIAIMGPSGTGKTTLARELSSRLDIPYVSGSLYDLMPDLPKNHFDLNQKYDNKTKHERNFQILNLRKKQYASINGSFITDRSIYDTAGYDIQENAIILPPCDLDNFIQVCNNIQVDLNFEDKGITHLILIPFNLDYFYNWPMEDDGKRITNPYFQSIVSHCQALVLNTLGLYVPTIFGKIANLFRKNIYCELATHGLNWEVQDGPTVNLTHRNIKVLVLAERNHNKRMEAITKFLNK